MTLPSELSHQQPSWIEEASPCNNLVVISRARYARNLASFAFAPHASAEVLATVCEAVESALGSSRDFSPFLRIDLAETSGTERTWLKELRLISREMERAGTGRMVYVRRDLKASIMVNEEDHLRVQCLEPGLQISKAQEALAALDRQLAQVLQFAYHQRLGFLTACPSNVGTGLRVSVMMHLPGLTQTRELESALGILATRGLTVRGFHGENSENLGDFFQISNEVTLGRTVQEIEENLAEVVSALVEREVEARSLLLKRAGVLIQDAIWRSYGLLAHARKMESIEAMKLLSRVRIGLDAGYFPHLTHEKLNRLIVEIQPGHLILNHHAGEDPEKRDVTRADIIRRWLGPPNGKATTK